MIPLSSLIYIFHALLLERKIIFIANDVSNLSLIIDSLLFLAQPLKTETYTLIPVLDERYLDYLDAPIPYIIGLSK